MQKEEITAYVIKELGKHHSRDEIIHNLCEQTGMKWPEAEKVVRQVAAEHSQEIKARQSPLVIALGVISIIGGVGLIIYCAAYFLSFTQENIPNVAGNGRGAIYAIGALFTGITLIAGAMIGLRKTIQELFEDKENR